MDGPVPPIEARVSTLERRAARLQAACVLLALAVAVTFVWELLPRPELHAQRFLLHDAHGRWRGALMTRDGDGAPMVRLNDEDGRARLLGLLLPDHSVRLRLVDSAGVARLDLELDRSGRPHALLLGADGHVRARLEQADDSSAVLALRRGTRTGVVTGGTAPARP